MKLDERKKYCNKERAISGLNFETGRLTRPGKPSVEEFSFSLCSWHFFRIKILVYRDR